MRLPQAFLETMREMFAQFGRETEFAAFVEAFSHPPAPALRINRGKQTREEGLAFLRQQYQLPEWVPVPWSADGVYVPDGFAPGGTAEYLQGLFYLQEASAMLPAQIAAAQPGQWVLDLCSAPGGKATRLSDDLQGQGVLLCNEPSLDRARVLLRNLEQWGSFASVLHAKAQELPESFQNSFDLVVVDAPCSGEGMFARDPRAIASWETYHTASCAPLQAEILDVAARVLAPGGRLVYSTCTFNLEENERQIARFLQSHPEFTLQEARDFLPPGAERAVSPGFPSVEGAPTERCLRLWPHQVRGEGHFCASLRKDPTSGDGQPSSARKQSDGSVLPRSRAARPEGGRKRQAQSSNEDAILALWQNWAQTHLTERLRLQLEQEYHLFAERQYLHALPLRTPDSKGLHWLKRGVLLGSGKCFQGRGSFQGKWTPSQALALYLKWDDVREAARLEIGGHQDRIRSYLAGQTWIPTEEERNRAGKSQHILLFANHQPIGWLAATQDTWKNLYPASWQRAQIQLQSTEGGNEN